MGIYADGQYHLIASYMVNRCDVFESYSTNSAFLRATASNPAGPWTYQQTVFPPFHHGAHVDRYIDGTYLIFGDGRDMPLSTVQTNCAVVAAKNTNSSSTSKKNKGNRRRRLTLSETLREDFPELDNSRAGNLRGLGANLYPKGNSPNDVHMVASSKSIYGPWTQTIILQTDLTKPKSWDCNITNLAPVILDNGTIVMAFRSRACVDLPCGNTCQNIGIAVSQNGWQGPWVKRPDPLDGLAGNEDPYMWKDEMGWHLIMHGKVVCGGQQNAINTCGTMAYSPDSYTWYLSPFAVYDEHVNFDPVATGGKTQERLEYRQRPKLLFDSQGVPLVLYNSGQRKNQPYQRSFSFKFNVAAMRNFRPPPKCIKPLPGPGTCEQFPNKVLRNFRDCQAVSNHCVWCPNKGKCVFGSDDRFCTAPYPDKLLDHC